MADTSPNWQIKTVIFSAVKSIYHDLTALFFSLCMDLVANKCSR